MALSDLVEWVQGVPESLQEEMLCDGGKHLQCLYQYSETAAGAGTGIPFSGSFGGDSFDGRAAADAACPRRSQPDHGRSLRDGRAVHRPLILPISKA